jgi:alkylhydroperoxidase family enzyme
MHGEDDRKLGEQERAIVAYARKLTREPWTMTAADLDSLRATGLSEAQTLDVVLIACLFNFMTRLADGLGVEVEPITAKFVEGWLEAREGPEWEFLRPGST